MSPQAALKPYLRLQNLRGALKKAQIAAEDAAPHLIDHVDGIIRTLWQQMKDAFAKDLEEALTKMKWPGKDTKLEGRLAHDWIEGVEKLLDLQRPYVIILFSLVIAFEVVVQYLGRVTPQNFCSVSPRYQNPCRSHFGYDS